jgi:hypothetical protein
MYPAIHVFLLPQRNPPLTALTLALNFHPFHHSGA